MLRKEEGRGHASFKNYMDELIHELEKCIKKSQERLISAVNNSNVNIKKNRRKKQLKLDKKTCEEKTTIRILQAIT